MSGQIAFAYAAAATFHRSAQAAKALERSDAGLAGAYLQALPAGVCGTFRDRRRMRKAAEAARAAPCAAAPQARPI